MNICKFCKKTFTSPGNLLKHQKTAKFCIKIQKEHSGNEQVNNTKFICKICNKDFSSKFRLESHTVSCSEKYKNIVDNTKKEYIEIIVLSKEEIERLKIENEDLRGQLKTIAYETEIRILRETNINQELHDKLHQIALTAIEQKNHVISSMVKKYIKKQPRKQYEYSNVIYILTTPSLKQDNRYILGKAKNLTNRLSTYNKSDEHEVIFYQDCGDEEAMNALEPFVFKKLNEYREQANRERFILPKDKSIDFFIDTIKTCFEFLK